MERAALLIITCCAAFSPSTFAAPPDPSWRLAREAEGIAVYTRNVAESEFDESLARTVVQARLAALTALIMDGDSHWAWIDTVVESRRLDAVSPSAVYIYSRIDAPWPVADRDAIVLSRAAQDRETLAVTIGSSARPDHLPGRDGVVRVPLVESTWSLVPRPDGAVEVSYRVHKDPGGEISSWLVNSVATDQSYKTLENLRRLSEGENAYRDAVLPYIREPDRQTNSAASRASPLLQQPRLGGKASCGSGLAREWRSRGRWALERSRASPLLQ